MMQRVLGGEEDWGPSKSHTFPSNLVTTHSAIIALVRSLCPVGVCRVPRGLGTETCYITDPAQAHTLRMKTVRLPGSLTPSKSHDLATSQAADDPSTAISLQVFPKCQRFLYYFQNSCTSDTPICHQRNHIFKCRPTLYVNNL